MVIPPSDSELSDLESSARKSPRKQPPPTNKKSAKTVYDKAAVPPPRSSLAFSDDEDGEITFLPPKENKLAATTTARPVGSGGRVNNSRSLKGKSPAVPPAAAGGEVEFEFDSLLPAPRHSDSESDADFR